MARHRHDALHLRHIQKLAAEPARDPSHARSVAGYRRYGATTGHKQYTGFKALPDPKPNAWSADEAAAWLAARTPWVVHLAQILNSYDDYRKAYRESAAALHPNRGGSSELFQALGEIARVLGEHHARTNAAGGAV